MIREIGALLTCFVWLVLMLFVSVPEEPARPAHTHEPVHYQVRGRIYSATVCRTDSTLVRNGQHRRVPEILEPVIWRDRGGPQPIVDKP